MNGTGTAITGSTVLDGFTITGADGVTAGSFGGGLLCNGSAGTCSPMLSSLNFSGNGAAYGGGLLSMGILGGDSSPILMGVTFRGNYASSGGGAIYSFGAGGTSSPSFNNVTFDSNSAPTGGAIWNDGASGGDSSPAFANVTFHNNAAQSGNGGAMYNGGTSHALLENVILWGNTATGAGNQLYSEGLSSVPTIDYSVVEGGDAGSAPGGAFLAGTGNLSTDPMLGSLANNGGSTPTIAIVSGSSAIDAGTICSLADQRGLVRPVDGDGVGGAACDIGAFEYRPSHIFDDVPVSGKEWMEPWINEFYFNGITTGCGTGPLIYCPESSVTRAAMAVFVLRAMHGASYVPPAATHTFSDMPVTGKEWMEPWVDQLYAEGITSGCGVSPLRFCPGGSGDAGGHGCVPAPGAGGITRTCPRQRSTISRICPFPARSGWSPGWMSSIPAASRPGAVQVH